MKRHKMWITHQHLARLLRRMIAALAPDRSPFTANREFDREFEFTLATRNTLVFIAL